MEDWWLLVRLVICEVITVVLLTKKMGEQEVMEFKEPNLI